MRERAVTNEFANKNRVGRRLAFLLMIFGGIQKFHTLIYDENGVFLSRTQIPKSGKKILTTKRQARNIESDWWKASATWTSNLVVWHQKDRACRDTIYDGFDGLDFGARQLCQTKLMSPSRCVCKTQKPKSKMIPLPGVKRVLKNCKSTTTKQKQEGNENESITDCCRNRTVQRCKRFYAELFTLIWKLQRCKISDIILMIYTTS